MSCQLTAFPAAPKMEWFGFPGLERFCFPVQEEDAENHNFSSAQGIYLCLGEACVASTNWKRGVYFRWGVIGMTCLLMYTSFFRCLWKCCCSLLTEVKACHRRENGLWCSWIAVLLTSQHGIGQVSWGEISTPETPSQSSIRLEWKVVWSGCVKTYLACFFPFLKRLELSLREEKKKPWKLLQASLAIAFDFSPLQSKPQLYLGFSLIDQF